MPCWLTLFTWLLIDYLRLRLFIYYWDLSASFHWLLPSAICITPSTIAAFRPWYAAPLFTPPPWYWFDAYEACLYFRDVSSFDELTLTFRRYFHFHHCHFLRRCQLSYFFIFLPSSSSSFLYFAFIFLRHFLFCFLRLFFSRLYALMPCRHWYAVDDWCLYCLRCLRFISRFSFSLFSPHWLIIALSFATSLFTLMLIYAYIRHGHFLYFFRHIISFFALYFSHIYLLISFSFPLLGLHITGIVYMLERHFIIFIISKMPFWCLRFRRLSDYVAVTLIAFSPLSPDFAACRHAIMLRACFDAAIFHATISPYWFLPISGIISHVRCLLYLFILFISHYFEASARPMVFIYFWCHLFDGFIISLLFFIFIAFIFISTSFIAISASFLLPLHWYCIDFTSFQYISFQTLSFHRCFTRRHLPPALHYIAAPDAFIIIISFRHGSCLRHLLCFISEFFHLRADAHDDRPLILVSYADMLLPSFSLEFYFALPLLSLCRLILFAAFFAIFTLFFTTAAFRLITLHILVTSLPLATFEEVPFRRRAVCYAAMMPHFDARACLRWRHITPFIIICLRLRDAWLTPLPMPPLLRRYALPKRLLPPSVIARASAVPVFAPRGAWCRRLLFFIIFAR